MLSKTMAPAQAPQVVGTSKSTWMRHAEPHVREYDFDKFRNDSAGASVFSRAEPAANHDAAPKLSGLGVIGLLGRPEIRLAPAKVAPPKAALQAPAPEAAKTLPQRPENQVRENKDRDADLGKLMIGLLDEKRVPDSHVVFGARALACAVNFFGKLFKWANDAVDGGKYINPGRAGGYWARLGILGVGSAAIGARAMIRTMEDHLSQKEKSPGFLETLRGTFLGKSSSLASLASSKLGIFAKISKDDEKTLTDLFGKPKEGESLKDNFYSMPSKLTLLLMELALQKRPSGFLWLRRWKFNRTFARLQKRLGEAGLLNADGKIELNPALLKDTLAHVERICTAAAMKAMQNGEFAKLSDKERAELMRLTMILQGVKAELQKVDVIALIAKLREKGFNLDCFEGV